MGGPCPKIHDSGHIQILPSPEDCLGDKNLRLEEEQIAKKAEKRTKLRKVKPTEEKAGFVFWKDSHTGFRNHS